MFWVYLVFRVVFWGTVLAVGYWVYYVGVERAARDVRGMIEKFERGVDGGGVGREL